MADNVIADIVPAAGHAFALDNHSERRLVWERSSDDQF